VDAAPPVSHTPFSGDDPDCSGAGYTKSVNVIEIGAFSRALGAAAKAQA